MSVIKAVLFDVDGVLLDSAEANVAFYRELFRQIGDRQPDDQLLLDGKHLSVEAMLRQVLPHFSNDQINHWMNRADLIDAGFHQLRPMPGIIEILPKLATTYHLGLVTNRTTSGVEELWKIVPLKSLFTSIAAYEHTKKHKPDPEPVRWILKNLGCERSEAVFIGDSITDLQAGKSAGVHFIMYGATPVPAGIPVLRDFLLLPHLLQSLT